MPDRLREGSLKNPSQTCPWVRRLTLKESRRRIFLLVLPLRHIFARAIPHCGKQTHGVYRGLPRRSPSGRRRAHQLVRQVRHKRHAAATRIPPLPSSCLAYPCGISSPAPYQTAACKPTGYTMAHPSSFYKSYKSYKSYASATPTQHAYPRCHQVALHYPAVNLPVALPLRHIFARAKPHSGTANPRGITWLATA